MDTTVDGSRRAWAATVMLGLAFMVAVADQALPSLMMEPIKHDLHLTDPEIALLTSFSITVAMAVASFPLAWIADRHSRRALITAAMTIWCVMTAASGFATTFTSLFLLRMGVGIGEAALMPAAYSLIADLFPQRQLPRAFSIVTFGGLMGLFVGLSGGGALYKALHDAAVAGTFSFAPESAWRWTTFLFGIAGLLVTLLVAIVVPEPKRTSPAGNHSVDTSDWTLGQVLKAGRSFYIPYAACLCTFQFFSAGFRGWLAPFFTRTYGWSIEQVGQATGTVSLISGLASIPLSLWLSRFVRNRMGREAPVVTICIVLIAGAPFVIFAALAPNGWLALGGHGVSSALFGVASIVSPIVLTSTCPPAVRARFIALAGLLFNLLGSSLGSPSYASFTEYVLRDPTKLYVTMSLLSATLISISIACCIIASRRYQAVQRRF